ncbi:hypothetical protein [Sulfurimonas sp.]
MSKLITFFLILSIFTVLTYSRDHAFGKSKTYYKPAPKPTKPIVTDYRQLWNTWKIEQSTKTKTPTVERVVFRTKADGTKLYKVKRISSANKTANTKKPISRFKELLEKLKKERKKETHKVIQEPIRKKKQGLVVQAVPLPLTPKKPTSAPILPKKITPPKPKPQVAQKSDEKTVLKNVNILTSTKTGNIDTKGKLSIANVKIAKGTTLKDTNINSDVKVKNISVSKGSSADIGSVKIEN